MKTLANTTILSNFAAVGRLDLLEQLHGRLYIPSQVYEEILDGLEQGYAFYAGISAHIHPFSQDGWMVLVSLIDGRDRTLYILDTKTASRRSSLSRHSPTQALGVSDR